jgi:hypothetical protein
VGDHVHPQNAGGLVCCEVGDLGCLPAADFVHAADNLADFAVDTAGCSSAGTDLAVDLDKEVFVADAGCDHCHDFGAVVVVAARVVSVEVAVDDLHHPDFEMDLELGFFLVLVPWHPMLSYLLGASDWIAPFFEPNLARSN